jgi:hypothetical protein
VILGFMFVAGAGATGHIAGGFGLLALFAAFYGVVTLE